jgi:hypothetical protein
MHLRISPRYGVNPGLTQCFFCLETSGVALYGMYDGDSEAPRIACIDMVPCTKCEEYMKQGVILVSIDDKEMETPSDNPQRTGSFVVVRDDFIKRAIKPQELVDQILQKRFTFVPDAAWDKLGLPRSASEQETP